MKAIATVLLVLAWLTQGFAQVSTPVLQTVSPRSPKHDSQRFVLSDRPSTDELTRAFRSSACGLLSPIELVQAIAAKGESCVNPLLEILKSDSMQVLAVYEDSAAREVRGPLSNRVLAILALGTIGNPASISALFEFALIHSDVEVRAACLNVLSNSYYYSVRDGAAYPDAEVVHILLRNLDDTTLVPYIQRTMSDISMEGLRRWLGDEHCPSPSPPSLIRYGEGKQIMTIEEYREMWWNQCHSKFNWNKDEFKFVLGK